MFSSSGVIKIPGKHESSVNDYVTTSQIIAQILKSITDMIIFFFFFGIKINNMILCFYWYSLFKVTAKFWVWMTERLELPLTEMGKTTRAVLEGSSRVHFEYVTLEMEGRWCCQNTVIQGKGLNYKYHLRRYHHIYNI